MSRGFDMSGKAVQDWAGPLACRISGGLACLAPAGGGQDHLEGMAPHPGLAPAGGRALRMQPPLHQLACAP